MVICMRPECQTTAGCVCANKLYDYHATRARIAALESENASLRKKVEQERAFNAAILTTIPINRILSACENGNTAIQYFKDLHARATRAEAEAAALRKALEKPVAWQHKGESGFWHYHDEDEHEEFVRMGFPVRALYAERLP